MNIYLISEYVNRMQKQDVNNFALKQGITLDNEELDRHLYNGTIKEYRRQTELTPKITKENSLLYRELFKEEIKPQNKQLSGRGHSRKKLRK